MRDPSRIIDASLNRATEALRVMEDGARFLLDDRDLCAELKSMRHGLRAAVDTLGVTPHASRDTPGDVGTGVSTESEAVRAGARDVIASACKRLSESLRSMEEWSKCASLPPGEGYGERAAPRALEALRYRAYEAERRLLTAIRPPFAGWRLCVLLTESLCARPWLDVARAAIDGGADCIQLREKDLDDADLLRRARVLVESARDSGCAVAINDRVDVALLSGADAAHLGQGDLPLADARALAGDRIRLGVSTAEIGQAEAALRAGADYCGAGPMFVSTTKRKERLSGPKYLREYLAHEPALPPALAISGIDAGNVGELVDAAEGRPFGVAVSSAVCAADDPARACAGLLERLPARADGA